MSAAERAISNQFNPQAEISLLRRNPGAGEVVKDNILHTLAEFVCQVPIVNYYYVQKNNSLFSPGLEQEGDVLNIYQRGVRPESRRSYLEYEGFYQLRQQILETRSPSFGVWVSPPGPKSEGYGDYGYFYIALIPEYFAGQDRKIQMLALRINDFNDNLVSASQELLQFLSPQTKTSPSPEAEDLLLNPLVFPVGKDQEIEDVYDLFALIASSLEQKLDPDLVEDGLLNKTLNKIRQKFRSKIYQIYTDIWSATIGIPVEISTQRLFREFPLELFQQGSCPSASMSSSSSLETLTKSDKKEEHWCPLCGEWFNGSRCPCGYIIDQS